MNSVPINVPRKNLFDLSHDVLQSMDMGYLVPVFVRDCLPSDVWRLKTQALCRFAPMVFPQMTRVRQFFHWWFVPNRILWENWENWILAKKVAGVVPAAPYFDLASGNYFGEGTLGDYMGIPPIPAGNVNTERISAFGFAAYQKIYNDRYRDQQLIPEVTWQLQDGANSFASFRDMRKRAWVRDYFTSSLPTPQKGDPVEIPLGEVELLDNWDINSTPRFEQEGGVDAAAGDVNIIALPNPRIESTGAAAERIAYDPQGSLVVGSTTVNDLRMAIKLQEWEELNARVGDRYDESNLGHFGVKSQDYRLQRPEFIGGSSSLVNISEVLNTTGTPSAPQGEMAGHGVGVTNSDTFTYKCHEHGILMCIMSVMPEPAYQQGIDKFWLKHNNNMQHYWPLMANIGEQPVLNREIFAWQDAVDGDATFGYLPAYSDYRFVGNRVAGAFRSSYKDWHMGRIFDDPPALNQAFIECDATTRIFAVPDTNVQHLFCHIRHVIGALRPVPKYGVPNFS